MIIFQGKELEDLRRHAWFVVVPSEWYENNPFSIIESFSDGVPVIGAKIGGIPELIKNNENGFLYESKNTEQLQNLLIKSNKLTIEERNKLGQNARDYIKQHYNPEIYYKKLLLIYKKAINENKK